VHFFSPDNPKQSRRLRRALLFSLALHALLLFFVRVAQPDWKSFASGRIPLRVTLSPARETLKPTAIASADQNSAGAARTGVEDNTPFPERSLTTTARTPTDTFRADIPKSYSGKEVMTVKKSATKNIIKTAPDLLVNKTLPPPPAAPEEKNFAPAPSVEKPLEVAPPPTQKLVSATPVAGEKAQKIVIAEAVPIAPPAEKPVAEPAAPKPVKAEEPKPVKAEESKPVRIEEPKPVKVEEPKPAKVEEPKPVQMEEPKPAKAAEPARAPAAEPKSAKTEAPKPEAAAEPTARATSHGDSDVFRAVPTFRIPGLADLNLSSIKKSFGDSDRKIKFGERRKTVSMKEQDVRYAMYIESVRLKLQRIGQFNYPAQAARDNLSGNLVVMITLRADGSLESFGIIQRSEYEVFNVGAKNIVEMSAPFSPFPDDIRQETDVLSIRINWSFSKEAQSFD
jgi:protein TonB